MPESPASGSELDRLEFGMARIAALLRPIVVGLAAAFSLTPAQAQQQAPSAKPEMYESCPGLISRPAPRVIPAAFRQASLTPHQVRVTYVGHSSFLLESPQLVRIVTDYNGYNRPAMIPDIVTMNHAHSSHYTDTPEPEIKHVLRGWGPSPDKPARHDLNVKDVHIRNVPTNIRNWSGGTERHGNSIFIFEIGSLCIAHLGHLHHTLTQQQLNEIGKIDVVLVPVDGGATLDIEGMIEVLEALKPKLMIPMHFFSTYTLNRFLDRAKDKFPAEFNDTPSVVVAKTSLPAKPRFLVLPGY
jgi:L-ascorbate metabolism protein UlaG (beta-lactamase superfamily)